MGQISRKENKQQREYLMMSKHETYVMEGYKLTNLCRKMAQIQVKRRISLTIIRWFYFEQVNMESKK